MALIFLGNIGLWRLNQAQHRFEYVQTNIIPGVKELENAKYDFATYARSGFSYLLSTDDAGRTATVQEIDALDKVMDQHFATYQRDYESDDTDRQMLESDKETLTAYRAALKDFEAIVRTGDLEAARASLMVGPLHHAGRTLRAGMDSHIAYDVKLGHDLRDANNTAYSHAFWLLMSCMVAALVVSGGLGLQLYRLITSGLNSIQQTLQHVSQSLDLTHTAELERMDEIGSTATAFNALLARVAEVVREVRGSAGSVSVAARNLTNTSPTLTPTTRRCLGIVWAIGRRMMRTGRKRSAAFARPMNWGAANMATVWRLPSCNWSGSMRAGPTTTWRRSTPI
jgi:methyl-accepting chemotaxis protein